MDIDIDNYTWIASQIEDYHNSLEKWTPLEALQERELIGNRLKYIGLPPEKKQELWKMLGGVK